MLPLIREHTFREHTLREEILAGRKFAGFDGFSEKPPN